MDNLEVREFSQAIINFVNKSPLPVEVKRLCINDIAAQLQAAADARIKIEILERDRNTGDNAPMPKKQEERHEYIESPSADPVEK